MKDTGSSADYGGNEEEEEKEEENNKREDNVRDEEGIIFCEQFHE